MLGFYIGQVVFFKNSKAIKQGVTRFVFSKSAWKYQRNPTRVFELVRNLVNFL